VAIALYDIGEFARFYPNGRVVVSKLGGKDLAMKRINDEDAGIRRYALQAVSKIMVTNWEFMK
jgi:V-type H+-transporting ATPase subunit H